MVTQMRGAQRLLRYGENLSRSIGRRRHRAVVRALARVARPLVREVDGASAVRTYDMGLNGEEWLLSQVARDAVVFDVGANVGEWTERALARGAAEVHAFEIVPATAAVFDRRLGEDQRATLNRIGLGAAAGSVTVQYYPDNPALTTTATAYPHDLPHHEVTVDVTTGDEYLASVGIDRIDLLKVDVEGEEPNVLRGFADALAAGRIGAIQFEYGLVAVLQRFLIIDFYEMLEPAGFDIGPLLPDRVRFRDYDVHLELFEYVNWVAVHRSRPDLRAALGA